MDQVLNKLPVLAGKEIASSLKFYFTAVKKDHAHKAEQITANGIGRDSRPYYRQFARRYIAKKIKPKRVEKFITDNLLMINKHQNLNARCVNLMRSKSANNRSKR